MLQGLYVKNFALIDELSMDFCDGLNILTGETGAGKSILLGSIQTALGGKTSKEMIRNGADYASIELTFTECKQNIMDTVARLGLPLEEDIIISRRITTSGKSVSRINGEIVTTAAVKELAAQLLEIHGQQEHHTLLNKERHLALVDRYAGEEAEQRKKRISGLYQQYKEASEELSDASKDTEGKNRDCSYLSFAVSEIKDAALVNGEEEELSARFQKLSHAKALADGVFAAMSVLSEGNGETVDDLISQVIKSLSKVSGFDPEAEKLLNRSEEIAELVSDLYHDAEEYISSLSDYEEEYRNVSERLTLIHQLMSKYGKTIPDIKAYLCECEQKLEKYADYEGYLSGLQKKVKKLTEELSEESELLSSLRKKTAIGLTEKIISALSDMNFLTVLFEISFSRTDYSSNGYDSAEFLIATNPGEALKPLVKVASGGELSRIMLALKSVFADRDEIPTMIFDEIDTGISGRTAQLVSEKMALIAKSRQLFCITHLPQIASMADTHFYIEKTTDGEKTVTEIRKLTDESSEQELSRMLGGACITEAVQQNAKEMKMLAKKWKQKAK